jgi:hypothetical protein
MVDTPIIQEDVMAFEVFTSWNDGAITAGTEWRSQIVVHLSSAQIILLLISDDFMASDFCYSIEMKEANNRHDANQARVMPIILRPVDWSEAPFAKLQALPTGGKPVTDWPNQDNAFVDIVQGIGKAQTIVEYAFRHREDYNTILWVMEMDISC